MICIPMQNSVNSETPPLQIYLPAESLAAVVLANTIAEITIGPGFSSATLELYSAFSTGNINVFNATVQQLTIGSSG